MKVLVIPEYDPFGGTFTFLNRLLEIHRAHGIETAVLIEEQQLFPAAADLFERCGVKILFSRFMKSRFAPVADVAACWRAYRDFRPDLMVVSNGKPGIMTGILSYPVPVVFFMHSYPGHDKILLRGRLYLAIVSRLRNRIVTVSEFSARKISEFMGIPRARIDVVYNTFAPVGEYRDDKPPSMVLTVGHVTSYKNPELWIRVAEQVVSQRPDVRFVWLGDGDLLDAMRDLVSNAGLDHAVEFPGYCDDVRTFFRRTAVYFQPSLMESHGISVVEAMAHGIACVTSDAGGLPESVVNGETGFTCSPYDVNSFVARITELLAQNALREKLGAAGKARAEILFSEEKQERKIVRLYEELTKITIR